MIGAVYLTWPRLSLMEQEFTERMKGSLTFKAGLYWEKRLDGAHKRYRKALESLARVRKLLKPSVNLQVNLANEGGQQVNVQKGESNAK